MKLYGQHGQYYDNIVFDLEEKHLYVSFEKNKIAKFFINEEKNCLDLVMETKSDLQSIKKMKMSQKYEFLIVNGENGVALYDP